MSATKQTKSPYVINSTIEGFKYECLLGEAMRISQRRRQRRSSQWKKKRKSADDVIEAKESFKEEGNIDCQMLISQGKWGMGMGYCI
jgi:hypothetical protein